MNNNLLDLSDEKNQLFIACVVCVLCEQSPITINLDDIRKYWMGEIKNLQYDMASDGKSGSITFSLKH